MMRFYIIAALSLIALPTWAEVKWDAYKTHESPALRAVADKVEHAQESMLALLQAEEDWLLGKIADAARSTRTLSPQEAELAAALQTASPLEAKVLRERLTWFPVVQGAEPLVARLRQNLRQRLAWAEQLVQEGVGSPLLVAELRGKLTLCPEVAGKADPAEAMPLKDYLAEVETGQMSMACHRLKSYRAGAADLAQVLQAEAKQLHILIMGSAVLPHVPAEAQAYLEKLQANLLEQQRLIAPVVEAGALPEFDLLELQAKLAAWFPQKQ